MKQISQTWEEKLVKTERIQNERQQALEKMGISVQASGIKVEKNKYYLVNLNADPSLNELLVYYLKVLASTLFLYRINFFFALTGTYFSGWPEYYEPTAGHTTVWPWNSRRTLYYNYRRWWSIHGVYKQCALLH